MTLSRNGRRLGRPPGRTIGHGRSMYQHYGCRCETCRAANAKYQQLRKLRKLREG